VGGGQIFRPRPDRPWGSPSLLYNGYRVTFPGVERPGRGVDHPTHLGPRSKKEQSYTSTPPLAFVACSRVNLLTSIRNCLFCSHNATLLFGLSPCDVYGVLVGVLVGVRRHSQTVSIRTLASKCSPATPPS